MNALPALPAVAALPAIQARPSAPGDATVPADAGADPAGEGGFAIALEHARAPAKARAEQGGRSDARKPDAARWTVSAKAEPALDERGDEGIDTTTASRQADDGSESHGAAPDLTVLLPGWPPAPTAAAALIATAPAGTAARNTAKPPLGESDLRVRPLEVDARGTRRDMRDAVASPPLAAASEHATRSAADAAPPVATEAPAHRRADVGAVMVTAPEFATPQRATPGHAECAASSLATAATAALHSAPAAPLAISASSTTSTAPFETRLAAPIDTPAFAPALAHQISGLADAGVQHARIALNPPEMGPLAVRIVLDGTQARIDFSADLAATRGAIEASLPTLAAALEGSGLTLAGGGVFDGQSRHDAHNAHDAPMPQRGAAATAAFASDGASARDELHGAGTPMRAARGLVDLIA